MKHTGTSGERRAHHDAVAGGELHPRPAVRIEAVQVCQAAALPLAASAAVEAFSGQVCHWQGGDRAAANTPWGCCKPTAWTHFLVTSGHGTMSCSSWKHSGYSLLAPAEPVDGGAVRSHGVV